MKRSRFFASAVFGTVLITTVAMMADDDTGADRNLAPNDAAVRDYAARMVRQGRDIFRFDTFGDEAFWGGSLHLHQAIAGSANGGTAPGLSPRAALSVGLKVDAA